MLPQLRSISCGAQHAQMLTLLRMAPAAFRAEEQEYRERVRKQKQMIYDQYLWRKLLLQDFATHVGFMDSPAWEASYRAKLERCSLATAN